MNPGPSADKIRYQLINILKSDEFAGSEILSRFLKFVIEESLSGRDREIKEYTIGLKVLQRNSSFNPQLDAAVRIHAGRLRRALNHYYEGKGSKDPVRIEIPKGGYAPLFSEPDHSPNGIPINNTESRKPDPAVHKKPSQKIKIAVLPFFNLSTDNSHDYFVDGFGEQLSNDLTYFQDLGVVAYYSMRHFLNQKPDAGYLYRELGVQYVITGSARLDNNRIRINAQLIHAEDETQLWSESFEEKFDSSNLFQIQHQLTNKIISVLGGYYGVILRDIAKASPAWQTGFIESYSAVLWYYHYSYNLTSLEVLQQMRKGLEDAVKREPEYAVAWAILAEMYLDSYVLGDTTIENPKLKGIECAEKAVQIDPLCQHAQAALAWSYNIRKNAKAGIQTAEKTIELNPQCTAMVGTMGLVLVGAGAFERAKTVVENSIRLNPYYPWWYNTTLSIYYYNKKEYKQSLEWVKKMKTDGILWDPLLTAACLAQLGQKDEAEKQGIKLAELLPEFIDNPRRYVGAFIAEERLVDHLIAGLKKAGIKLKK